MATNYREVEGGGLQNYKLQGEILPLQNKGEMGGRSFSHPKGGHKKCWGSFNTGA